MMELFGTLCAVVGAGTLSAGLIRIIAQIDGIKNDRTRREAGYGRSANERTQ